MMGLSAFNRARQIRAQMNEQNKQEEHSRLEAQRRADETAAEPKKTKKQSSGKK